MPFFTNQIGSLYDTEQFLKDKQVTKPVVPSKKDCWLVLWAQRISELFMVWMKSQWIIALACPQTLRHPLSREQLQDLHLRIFFIFSFIVDSWLYLLTSLHTELLNIHITGLWHCASSWKAIDMALSWASAYPHLSPPRYFPLPFKYVRERGHLFRGRNNLGGG